jgi:hypothetical protein
MHDPNDTNVVKGITNLSELSQLLTIMAAHASDDVAIGLTKAARHLDHAIELVATHGDRSLQDLTQGAIFSAQFGISMQLRELLQEIRDVGKDTHQLVMGVQTDVQALTETANARFSAIEAAIVGLTTRADDGLSARGRQDERLATLEAQMVEVLDTLKGEAPGDGDR